MEKIQENIKIVNKNIEKIKFDKTINFLQPLK